MAFNNYITLDSLKYKTLQKAWQPGTVVPATHRVLLNGNMDSTYGAASLLEWQGEIVAPVTADGTGWGTITDLRSSVKKRQQLTFVDHYGTSYTAQLVGPFTERSASPKWDATNNAFYVSIRIRAKAT